MKRLSLVGAAMASVRFLAHLLIVAVVGGSAMALASEPGAGEQPAGADGSASVQQRPKVGLVLSGGGARGLAHIGVIRWLEEHRVPVDLVAGTSMGGLVGGIYATGADSSEMMGLIDTIDWALVLSTDTPYPQKAFRRKEDAREAPTTLELGLRDGIKLPPGLDAGHQVGLVLDRIAFPYSGLDSFDQMPTPFACVAVDLESGDEVVFRDGRLAEALRSTMSYPGWFSPVRSGDRVMIDGGVLNNLPTDVVLEMGADVIIAVDLGMLASEQAPFDSIVGVLNRTLSVMMRNSTDRNAALADTLITPDVSAFGFTDFDDAAELESIGYEAAEARAAELETLAIDEAAWDQFLADRESRRRRFQATPEFIDVEGAVSEDGAQVRAALRHHQHARLDPDALDVDLTNISGWGRYNVVGYGAGERDGQDGLEIDVHSKTFGPPFVRPILDIRGSEFGDALLTFGGRFTFYDVAGVNSEWRIDATYGQTTQARTELFVPLGHGGFFVAPRALAGLATERLYRDGDAVAEFDINRLGVGADVGYLFGPRAELRLGVDLAREEAEVSIGEPLAPKTEGSAGELRAGWSFDGTNSPLIPTEGVRVRLGARWIFSSPETLSSSGEAVPGSGVPDYYQAELDIAGARPLTGRFSLIGGISGGTSFDATAGPLRQFLVGGPLRLGSLHQGERRGSHFYLARAGVLWGLADESQLSFFGKFYLAGIYEVGDAFEKKTSAFHDVTFGLAGETILGGVFVGGAIGQAGRGGFFFAVGRLF